MRSGQNSAKRMSCRARTRKKGTQIERYTCHSPGHIWRSRDPQTVPTSRAATPPTVSPCGRPPACTDVSGRHPLRRWVQGRPRVDPVRGSQSCPGLLLHHGAVGNSSSSTPPRPSHRCPRRQALPRRAARRHRWGSGACRYGSSWGWRRRWPGGGQRRTRRTWDRSRSCCRRRALSAKTNASPATSLGCSGRSRVEFHRSWWRSSRYLTPSKSWCWSILRSVRPTAAAAATAFPHPPSVPDLYACVILYRQQGDTSERRKGRRSQPLCLSKRERGDLQARVYVRKRECVGCGFYESIGFPADWLPARAIDLLSSCDSNPLTMLNSRPPHEYLNMNTFALILIPCVSAARTCAEKSDVLN